MLSFWICCIVTLVALAGCAPSTIPTRQAHYPITSGSHESLPQRTTRIIVWGKQPVIGTASSWLERHGMTVIPREELHGLLNEAERTKLTHTFADAFVLRSHRDHIDAALILFADTEQSAEPASRVSGNFQPTSTLDVTVRGMNVKNGKVEWKGNAHYPPRSHFPDTALIHLACPALATAWGFRPPGQLEIPSNMMCEVGRTEPTVTP